MRRCAVVLPLWVAATVWLRARAWGGEGARLEKFGSRVMIRARGSAGGAAPELFGEFSIAWFAPRRDQATICRVAWNRAEGGSEADVWRVAELLAGGHGPRPLEAGG